MGIIKKFPTELKELKYQIEGYAKDYGLDFFPVVFEVLDFDKLNEFAAYGGFPVRYPHWKFGMDYEKLAKGYSYGLSKIYEMVINTNPSYAYLLKSNKIVDQKTVMAHVYGHVDFFKNNIWFSKTNRNMIDKMANHGSKIRKYVDQYGEEVVEDFIDSCLSIEDLIDPHSLFIKRKSDKSAVKRLEDFEVDRFKSKDYMRDYMNPSKVIKDKIEKLKKEKEKQEKKEIELVKIEGLEKDILKFLIDYAPLQKWEKDILTIIRKEAYYFAPQKQTRIMNEGWASYWHSKIMTEIGLDDSEIIEFAKHHAGIMGTDGKRLNPYKLGLELFLDIEDRWNKGKFGLEYEACKDEKTRKNWDKKLGLGREKIFEVREIYHDLSFIDSFLTEDFCREKKLFTYSKNETDDEAMIDSREFEKVKKSLIFMLTNSGKPEILLKDANYNNAGELLLEHKNPATGLNRDFAEETLKNLYKFWKRPVYLESKNHDGEDILFRCNDENMVNIEEFPELDEQMIMYAD